MIGGLILAAGRSSRAGSQNKLLFKFNGKPLVVHVAQQLKQSSVESIVAVTGFQRPQLEALFASEPTSEPISKPISCCYNAHYASGLASSLSCGVAALLDMDGIVVCLGDMPFVTADVINQLISVFYASPDKSLIIPVCKGQRGNPLLIGNGLFDHLLRLKGDAGARSLCTRHADRVQEVETDCAGILQDYDTQQELNNLQPSW